MTDVQTSPPPAEVATRISARGVRVFYGDKQALFDVDLQQLQVRSVTDGDEGEFLFAPVDGTGDGVKDAHVFYWTTLAPLGPLMGKNHLRTVRRRRRLPAALGAAESQVSRPR